jgi:hypothetical protein
MARAQRGGVPGAPTLILAGAKPKDFTWQLLVRGAEAHQLFRAHKGPKPLRAVGIKPDDRL